MNVHVRLYTLTAVQPPCFRSQDATIHHVRNVAPNKDMKCLTFKLPGDVAYAECPRSPPPKRPHVADDEGDEGEDL